MADAHSTPPTCACGCGQTPTLRYGKWKRFVHGHHNCTHHVLYWVDHRIPTCGCGCGEQTTLHMGKWRRYIHGHHARGKKGPASCGWRGGTSVHTSGGKGYFRVWMPEHHRSNRAGYVKRSVLVLEEKLGRALLPTEIVHHVNRDSMDDRPENLSAMTSSEHSLLHWREFERRNIAHGERAGNSKLTDAMVREIRISSGSESGVSLAKRFGVTPTTISRIVHRKAWNHVGEHI